MANLLTITYAYRFKNGREAIFPLALDKGSLAYVAERPPGLPLWSLLNFSKCAICPLSEQAHTYCPVAANLAGIVEEFRDFLSHEEVSVTVTTEERRYVKDTTIQQGLSPLLGIIMTTSGCPVMEQLKPMVRFHLPFASLEETVFRMVSMYLVSQFLRSREGRSAAWSLEGLAAVYAEVGQVNRDFAQRMRAAAKKDANVNALVNLDCFASLVPIAAEETLKELRPYFAAYVDRTE